MNITYDTNGDIESIGDYYIRACNKNNSPCYDISLYNNDIPTKFNIDDIVIIYTEGSYSINRINQIAIYNDGSVTYNYDDFFESDNVELYDGTNHHSSHTKYYQIHRVINKHFLATNKQKHSHNADYDDTYVYGDFINEEDAKLTIMRDILNKLLFKFKGLSYTLHDYKTITFHDEIYHIDYEVTYTIEEYKYVNI